MHLLDLRGKRDAQWECQLFSELLFERFKLWMPVVGAWYEQTRAGKARLAP
jgi:thymidylate synthase (FAD)